MKRDPDKILADAKRANRKVEDLSRRYTEATAERATFILEASDCGVARSTIARELDISPNRVQQILDRERARRAEQQ